MQDTSLFIDMLRWASYLFEDRLTQVDCLFMDMFRQVDVDGYA